MVPIFKCTVPSTLPHCGNPRFASFNNFLPGHMPDFRRAFGGHLHMGRALGKIGDVTLGSSFNFRRREARSNDRILVLRRTASGH